jgi:hypothetical protein
VSCRIVPLAIVVLLALGGAPGMATDLPIGKAPKAAAAKSLPAARHAVKRYAPWRVAMLHSKLAPGCSALACLRYNPIVHGIGF